MSKLMSILMANYNHDKFFYSSIRSMNNIVQKKPQIDLTENKPKIKR